MYNFLKLLFWIKKYCWHLIILMQILWFNQQLGSMKLSNLGISYFDRTDRSDGAAARNVNERRGWAVNPNARCYRFCTADLRFPTKLSSVSAWIIVRQGDKEGLWIVMFWEAQQPQQSQHPKRGEGEFKHVICDHVSCVFCFGFVTRVEKAIYCFAKIVSTVCFWKLVLNHAKEQ